MYRKRRRGFLFVLEVAVRSTDGEGLHRPVNAVDGDFAGEDVLFAAVRADDEAALFVYVDGFACALPAARQVKGHAAADVDTG